MVQAEASMRYVEIVQCRVPSGTTEAVIALAQTEGVSPSEVMRRAILTDMEERQRTGLAVAELDG
jgi:hypothetical protein